MITNLTLAILLVAIAISVTLTLDYGLPFIENLFRKLIRFAHRSRLLTEYLLKAYLRYRKAISQAS